MMREKQDYQKLIVELKAVIEQILTGQTQMQEDITAIKENLFDPDNGLYARVAKNTSFRQTASKWLWLLTGGLAAALLNGYISKLFN